MTPRDLICRFIGAGLLALAPAAQATVTSVSEAPRSPTVCDSVTLHAEGVIPNSCLNLESAVVSGPEPFPEWVGPLPAYRTSIVITLRQQSTYEPCVLVPTPYARDFSMGRMPAGQHFVSAVERVLAPDGTTYDSSRVFTSFVVSAGDTCTATRCVLLSFSPPPGPVAGLLCTASGQPAGEGCFDVDLANGVPVGGAQLRIRITDAQGAPVPASFLSPKSVTTTPRSAALQATWESDGSTLSLLLFSPTDAVILPGRGPILHLCYAVGQGALPGVDRIAFDQPLVADPEGRELPLCPTFREEVGRFCIGSTQGCDLNGDGVSDIRDIIRLVRCALAGAACPDTIAARADCNGDGAVDVRDVICCVRKLLFIQPQGLQAPATQTGTLETRIGFTGSTTWSSPLSGRAVIEVAPGTGFGGILFRIEPPAGVRITDLELASDAGLRLIWVPDVDGRVLALLLRQSDEAPAGSVRLTLSVEPLSAEGVVAGSLRLGSVANASWDGSISAADVTADTAPVAAAPIAAPAVYGARPNPFDGATEIPFALPAQTRASIRVYDVAGRLVRTLADGDRPAGVHRVSWDGKDARGRAAPAGIYFVKLDAAGTERTSRIVKLR